MTIIKIRKAHPAMKININSYIDALEQYFRQELFTPSQDHISFDSWEDLEAISGTNGKFEKVFNYIKTNLPLISITVENSTDSIRADNLASLVQDGNRFSNDLIATDILDEILTCPIFVPREFHVYTEDGEHHGCNDGARFIGQESDFYNQIEVIG